MSDILTRNKRHEYFLGKKKIPSVTTVLNVIHNEAIVQWKGKQVAECAIRNVGLLPGLVESRGPEEAVKWLRSVPDVVRDKASDKGTGVHQAAQDYLAGRTPILTPEEKPYFHQFVSFYEDVKPDYSIVESFVCNETHWYAGQLDGVVLVNGRIAVLSFGERELRWIEINGERWLVDIKSGKIYAKIALQLAAYRYSEWWQDGSGVRHPMPQIDRAVVVDVKADGWRLIEFDAGPATFDVFLHTLALYNWTKEVKQDAA